eukprot:7235156-Prymnesium_polylepis.2
MIMRSPARRLQPRALRRRRAYAGGEEHEQRSIVGRSHIRKRVEPTQVGRRSCAAGSERYRAVYGWSMGGLWVVYGWFMGGLWVVYGWSMGGL